MKYEFLITLLTIIVGFITTILTLVALNNQLRTELNGKIDKLAVEIKEVKDELNSKIDKLDTDIKRIQSDFNARFDKMNDLIIDLYKTLFKRDAA